MKIDKLTNGFNNVFNSLLKAQGITGLHHFRNQNLSQGNFFAYVKYNNFYICNEQMENISLDIINKERYQTICIVLNTKDNDDFYYFISSSINDEEKRLPNFIIDNKGKILKENVFCYQIVTTWLQTAYKTMNFDVLGHAYNVNENQIILPSDAISNYATRNTYISKGIFINGSFMENASFIFSYKNVYFIVDENKLFVFSENGTDLFNYDHKNCGCIWINKNNAILFAQNYDCNELTNNPIKTDFGFPFIICESRWADKISTICSTNEDLIIGTRDNWSNLIDHVYFFSSSGSILWDSHNCGFYAILICNIKYSNSLIFIKYKDELNVIYDKKGHEISSSYSHFNKYMVLENHLSIPVPFNKTETDVAPDFQKLYGVLNTETGGVLIPPIYTKVSIRETKKHLESIVTVTNFYNGIEKKYQGLYINETIVIPIGYDQISFIKFHSIYDNDYDAPYILFERNGKKGLVYENGTIIVDGCDSIKLLARKKIKSELPTYAVATKKKKIALIYKDTLVSDFILDEAEGLFPSTYDTDKDEDYARGEWAKAWKNGKAALWFCGKQVSNFYKDIKRVESTLFSNSSSTQDNILFLITNDNNLKGIHNSKDKVLLPCKYRELQLFYNFYYADGKYIDKNGTVFFNSDSYEYIDKAPYHIDSWSEYSFCYGTKNELLFIETWDDSHKITKFKRHDKKDHTYEFGEFEFNFEKEIFEEKPDDNFYYQECPDEYDYERDTYYALGGSDYENFKNSGGSLDDMMDGLGY